MASTHHPRTAANLPAIGKLIIQGLEQREAFNSLITIYKMWGNGELIVFSRQSQIYNGISQSLEYNRV